MCLIIPVIFNDLLIQKEVYITMLHILQLYYTHDGIYFVIVGYHLSIDLIVSNTGSQIVDAYLSFNYFIE